MRVSEQQLQRTIVQGLRALLPPEWMVVAVSNKPRSRVAGAIEKSMGTVAGWPDITVVGPAEHPFGFALLEIKAEGGRLSAEQREIHKRLRKLGHPVVVCRSWEDVLDTAQAWQWPLRLARVAA